MRFSSIILLFFSLSIVEAASEVINETNSQNNTQESVAIDTTKVLFFLDGKKASAMETLGKMESDSVQYVTGFGAGKNAVFCFGEKARNGLLVFKSTKKNDNENEK